ncbi:MAG: hypothetical protein KY453_06020 [Gemmatimonadetes bacterium]|nr:hypothetical protein [Gemmatimonadota bacterium]
MRRLLLLACLPFTAAPPAPAAAQSVPVVEATVAELQAALLEGRTTARELVEAHLARIEAYDRSGPSLNALVTVNPRALDVADSLDALLRRTGRPAGPLHGLPVIVKDNYDTSDLPTTAGSATLREGTPADDAFQVRRLREAGAIVLAKSNMAEFAFSPYETVGSALPGYTFNPYALNRVTAGSSGGTAAAVAASFGVVGLGTDTGNSIRGPSSHASLVGIRSTMGLTSRDGIVPLYLDRDVGGPMARTVEDAVRVFDVIAGSAPSPVDRSRWTTEEGEEILCDPDGPFAAYAFKTYVDPYAGRLSVLRVVSGRCRSDEALTNPRTGSAERLGGIDVLYNNAAGFGFAPFAEMGPDLFAHVLKVELQLVFNTTEGAQALADSRSLRRAALLHKVPYYTTLAGARAATTLPDLRPLAVVLGRLWPIFVGTALAGALAFLGPQIPGIAAGFTVIWSLSWRHQDAAVAAIEARDGVAFFVESASPFKPMSLVRTPSFRAEVPGTLPDRAG